MAAHEHLPPIRTAYARPPAYGRPPAGCPSPAGATAQGRRQGPASPESSREGETERLSLSAPERERRIPPETDALLAGHTERGTRLRGDAVTVADKDPVPCETPPRKGHRTSCRPAPRPCAVAPPLPTHPAPRPRPPAPPGPRLSHVPGTDRSGQEGFWGQTGRARPAGGRFKTGNRPRWLLWRRGRF
jgi:hypothetical protein